MTNQPTQSSEVTGRNGLISILLPCVLIAHLLWNVLIPAHELPLRHVQVMTMIFDALMFAGLIGLRKSIPAALFWIALVAGIGLFALRLSDDGWWTGHLVYSLPPR